MTFLTIFNSRGRRQLENSVLPVWTRTMEVVDEINGPRVTFPIKMSKFWSISHGNEDGEGVVCAASAHNHEKHENLPLILYEILPKCPFSSGKIVFYPHFPQKIIFSLTIKI